MRRFLLLPALLPAFLLTSPPPVRAAEPAPAGTFAIEAFSTGETRGEASVLGEMIASSLSLFLPFQTGWSEAETAAAVVKGSYRGQGGSLRIRAELLRPSAEGEEALPFSLSGRTEEVGLLLVELSTLIGEALQGTFLPRISPPLPSSPTYLFALATPSFAPRDPDEEVSQTEAFLLSAITLDSANADACYKLGVLYAQTKRLEEGLAYLRTAADLRPDYARYHYAFGVALTMNGRRDEALGAFLQAALIDSASAESYLALGLLQRQLGDFEAARSAVARAEELLPGDHSILLAADPRSAEAYVNLGVLEQKSGSGDLARRNFSKALASRPDSPEALNNLALLEGSKGYSPDVLARLEQARDAGPRHWEPVMANIAALQLHWGLWTTISPWPTKRTSPPRPASTGGSS